MKKNAIKRMICLVMTVMLLPVLTSCGKKAETGPDPNVGLYMAVSVTDGNETYDIDEVFEEGETMGFKLMDGGAGLYINNNSEENYSSDITWTRKGTKFHAEAGQAVFDGTIENGLLILKNLNDTGFDFYFELTDEKALEEAGEDNEFEEDNEAEEAEEAYEEEVAAYSKCTLYLSGGEDATAGMERVEDKIDDDGSYLIEHVSHDGMLSVIQVGKAVFPESESLEDLSVGMARWVLYEGDTSYDEKVELNDEYTENTSYPVYIVSFMTGENEDTWSWKAYTLATDTCGLVYAVGAPADYEDDMLDVADRVFPKLRVADQVEGFDTNGAIKMDLFAYYDMKIDDVAADLTDLQYDDSYKTAEGTTEISGPTDKMEKLSDGYALAGPFFTVNKEGTVVGINYGGHDYCVCEIEAGMPMSKAAENARLHGFKFSRVEVTHGTAKYVSIYDNGDVELFITSDEDGDFSKTEESDVTGNVDSILISKK